MQQGKKVPWESSKLRRYSPRTKHSIGGMFMFRYDMLSLNLTEVVLLDEGDLLLKPVLNDFLGFVGNHEQIGGLVQVCDDV